MKRKYLYLPVEGKSREFDAKVLLALAAVKVGWDVVIGREDILNEFVRHFPCGIYLAKNVNQDKDKFINGIYQKGFHIFLSDEEAGLAQNDFSIFLDQRISSNNLKKIHFTFLWSRVQEKVFSEKYNGLELKFSNAGSPRLDLMTKKFNSLEDSGANYYKSKYFDYILISSNFTVNNLHGSKVFKEKLMKTGKSARQKSQLLSWYEYKKKTFLSYLDFIKELSDLHPDINIVIRPHPGEDSNSWNDLKCIKNIFIDKSYSLISALKNSSLVIHHGCTASLESYLQGVPSIYYDPFKDEDQICQLCKDLSFYFTDKNEFFQKSDSFLNQSISLPRGRIKKVGIKSDGLCYQRFVDAFGQSAGEEGLLHDDDISFKKTLLKTFFMSPISFSKSMLRNYTPKLHPVGEILQEKCPTIRPSDIQELGFHKFLDMDSKNIKYQQLSKNLIHISKLSNG
jgi:surface carbohydrate biosynthesis protein